MDDERLTSLAVAFGGVFTTGEALSCGFDEATIARRARSGLWHRIRRGAYVTGAQWAASGTNQRHLLTLRAVLRASTGEVGSHTSGSLALGIDMWEPELEWVHTTYLDLRHGRREHGVDRHAGPLDPSACVTVNGIRIGPPATCVAGAMLRHPVKKAIVIGDSALNKGVVEQQELAAVAREWWFHPWSRRLRYAVSQLDDGAESPGESLARHLFVSRGLPRPETQYWVSGPDGFLARTDFAWPERGVLGEFDGKKKYLPDDPARDPGETVFAEKRREDRLRRLGWSVVRLVWADLFTPDATIARIGAALAHGAPAASGTGFYRETHGSPGS